MNLKMRIFSRRGTVHVLLILSLGILLNSCSQKEISVFYDFNEVPDRIWAGEDFWTVPLEDWKITNGKVECISEIQSASLSILTYVLNERNDPFSISVDMGLTQKGANHGSAGLTVGSNASEEKDIRAAVYFGEGINLGVNTEGYAFLGIQRTPLPVQFDFNKFGIRLKGSQTEEGYLLILRVVDDEGKDVVELSMQPETPVAGLVQIVNNLRSSGSRNNGPRFWYDNLHLTGNKFDYQPDNRFGPVLWTMYTLSDDVLKMTAQLPPIGSTENGEASLQIKNNKRWTTMQVAEMDPQARTVTWKLEDWDSSADKEYRVLFRYTDGMGKEKTATYDGMICKDPVNRTLRMGALTCQYHYGFPYSPLIKNLALSKPDILYFSGDQIYEQNGGYQIKREPEEVSILSYLGKWYMFGWAFGDLMRNLPTICTPDDHDVFHGNVWGEGGVIKTESGDDLAGFIQTPAMVNVVNRTQCAHLPDPYDPTPMKRGISVWYTALNYGRISFAIVTDRYFKSGPENVSDWEGRKDHLQAPLKDLSQIDHPELELLGKRQEEFIANWIRDWKNTDMKVLLSQTIFANVATHHGRYDYYLYGDLDSNGWPKMARDRALRMLRKAFVFHIAGDQHVPSMVQYGIENFRDAGWCYVTPAIAVGYSRWFRPDDVGIPVSNRPAHGYSNTGEYTDAFGNLNYVYAIGNPGDFKQLSDRYQLAQVKTSGYGMIIYNKDERTITMESWRFLANVENPGPEDQHPGWPLTIHQTDNYKTEDAIMLPKLSVQGPADPVLEVINSLTGESIYMLRIKGNDFQPWVFEEGKYDISVGYPETETWKLIRDISTDDASSGAGLVVSF